MNFYNSKSREAFSWCEKNQVRFYPVPDGNRFRIYKEYHYKSNPRILKGKELYNKKKTKKELGIYEKIIYLYIEEYKKHCKRAFNTNN